MRNQKTAEALTAKFATLEAPKPHLSAWEISSTQLRDLVTENMTPDGYEAKRTWAFDPYSQMFGFQITLMQILETAPGKRISTSTTASFDLDPKADIVKEITRLQKEVQEWREAIKSVRRAQLAAILKEQGQAAFDAAVRDI